MRRKVSHPHRASCLPVWRTVAIGTALGAFCLQAGGQAVPQPAAAIAVTGDAGGAPSSSASITFRFENPALDPAAYTIEIHEDGRGHYRSEPGTAAAPDAQGALPQAFEQAIEVRNPLLGQWFAVARSHRFFAIECESRQHHVAFTGRKTLSYLGADGKGACTYNYSQDSQLSRLADNLVALSFTLEEGRKLRLEYLHDRLGLDAELQSLSDAVARGSAVELENLAPELKSIAADPEVMDRARARAKTLLLASPKVGATP